MKKSSWVFRCCCVRRCVRAHLVKSSYHIINERYTCPNPEFPQLATAVAECRDTASVILVDAGDRWTGNAYVDQAEGRRPVLELMNELGYDVATLGNHELTWGSRRWPKRSTIAVSR